MDVDRLRAFVTVARSRRFVRAARVLGVSQPSLSRRVQQLEHDVGAKLVVRTPAGVVLTSAGERFLPHAERALASVDAGRTAIDELSGQPRGTVTLGSQPTISAYVLPPVPRGSTHATRTSCSGCEKGRPNSSKSASQPERSTFAS